MSSEEAVGILAYANSNPGFRGILKQRLVLFDGHYGVEESFYLRDSFFGFAKLYVHELYLLCHNGHQKAPFGIEKIVLFGGIVHVNKKILAILRYMVLNLSL